MRTGWSVSILVLVLLALSACDRLGTAQSAAMRQKAGSTTGCPTVTEGTQLLMNEAHGYCLLYPAGYLVQYPNDSEAVLFVGSLMNVDQPRASIKVQGAAGRTATQVADELIADWIMGFDIKRTEVIVGGEKVIVLDNIPGRDIYPKSCTSRYCVKLTSSGKCETIEIAQRRQIWQSDTRRSSSSKWSPSY